MPCVSEKSSKKKLGLFVREDLIEAMESLAVATGGTTRDKGMVIHAAIRMFLDAPPRAQYDYMKDEVAVKLDEWLAGQDLPDAEGPVTSNEDLSERVYRAAVERGEAKGRGRPVQPKHPTDAD